MKAAIVRVFGVILFSTVFLAGCGQKGDLYHPNYQAPERVHTE